jgi:outer membrane lipoprotein-sorting protein
VAGAGILHGGRFICQPLVTTRVPHRPALKSRSGAVMAGRMSRVTFPARRLAVALALCVVVAPAFGAGCPKSEPASAAHSDDRYAKVQQALNARVAAIHDVAVEGSIADPTGQTLRFRYAMQQPSFMAGELLAPDGSRARAFIFDGKHLAIVDDGTRTIVRQDLSTNEEQMLLTLHQVFSPFVCEGWRPPLLKPTGVTTTADGDTVVLTVPVGEGGVKEQRVVLRSSGAFVSRQTIGDDGAVLMETTVLEDATDTGTGLAFPVKWAMKEGASRGTVTLSSWQVNAGVDAARFDTRAPAGYTERQP